MEEKLVSLGLKGMTANDRHLFWTNREVMLRLKEAVVGRRQGLAGGAAE